MALCEDTLRIMREIAEEAAHPTGDDRLKYEGTLEIMDHLNKVSKMLYKDRTDYQAEYISNYMYAYRSMVKVFERKYMELGWEPK